MRKLALCIVLFIPLVYLYSQDLDYYYIEFKDGFEPQNLQTTVNTDQTLTLSMQNTDLAAALNEKPMYVFEKAFPLSQRPMLQKIYLMVVARDTSMNNILQKEEIENLILIDDTEVVLTESPDPDFLVLPNDFYDLFSGERNTSLDLIRLPLAWTVTKGNTDILIGMSDANIDENHEDLVGKIEDIITLGVYTGYHGTAGASIIASKTNNNKGIAGVSPNSKIVFIETNGLAYQLIQALYQLIHYENIRIINCSWRICQNSPSLSILSEIIEEANEKDILVIASAANGPPPGNGCQPNGHGYGYPASFDDVISVTSVGDRFSMGVHHNIINPNTGNPYQVRSWKDIHLFRPHITGNEDSHTRNDKVDVTAPGQLTISATNDYNAHPSGYFLGIGTSRSAPYVTGVAALVFAANPNLTAQQVKDIILNTADDIYHIPYNQPYVGLLGTGRVNAYRAVLTAKCIDDFNYAPNLDLMVRNSMIDYGYEPDNNTQQVLWNSQEIWVRHNSGESYIDVHENPEYDPVIPNYVNVRVTNRSCVTSSGNEELTLYWAKANTALNWPDHWDGSLVMGDITNTNSQTPVGGVVGTLNIPPLEPGQEAILEFEWMVPNPQDYFLINENPWHFCLLARIETPSDPMTFVEGTFITDNVRNNNNIAWKNTSVVNIIPDTPTIGGLVAVSNPFTSSKTYTLELFPEAGEYGKALYEEAEIGIEMDEVLYQAWARGNKEKTNLKATSNGKKFIVSDSLARLENIQFYPNEYGTVYVTFNFLTKEVTGKRNYTYHLAQIDALNNKVIGGETFEIRKQPRPTFTANAGDDQEIDKSESVTLQASEINEDAVYNWYDIDGNLIYTGTTITVSPQFTQQYKLEVISNLDGLKDYDELQVTVNPYKIESLVPNPAISTVTVNYLAEDAGSAYLMVVHQNTGNTSNYIIDTEENSHTIDLSTFATGLYSIILVCDGEIQGSKNLVIQ